MTIRDGIALLEYTELVNPNCLSVPQYKHGVADGLITVVQRGSLNRPALIDWPSLDQRFKDLVKRHLDGDPDQLAQASVIERFLSPSPADESYIDAYRSTNGLLLNDAKRAAMKKAAPVLAFLVKVDDLRRTAGVDAVAGAFGMGSMQLKAAVLTYIKVNKLGLPTSFSKLEARKRAYKEALAGGHPGAASLVHGNHGNDHSSKVGGDDQTAVLRLLASRHQNFGKAQLAAAYNQVAQLRQWPTITPGTVANFLKDGASGRTATFYAKGRGAYQGTYGVINHRSRPSSPTLMWVLDGKVYELYYQKQVEKAGKLKTGWHYRKTVVVVLDPHSWYPVGFAIGDQENTDLNKLAMKNAVEHMHELTGQYWLPWQVQSDRFAKAELTAFYGQVAAYYTPAAAYNARAKVIEPYFKHHDDQYVQRHPNYGGHNIDSRRENQPNPDAIERLKKDFPDEAGVIAQIVENFSDERLAKRDEFLRGLEAMEPERRRTIDRSRFLELFGTQHTLSNGYVGNELTNGGLQPTLLGQKRCYNILTNDFQDLVGTTFTITYDPSDLSNVLATAREGSIRFLVPEMAKVPMALMDHTPETRALLAEREAFKKALGTAAMAQVRTDAERVFSIAARALEEAQRPNITPVRVYVDEREAVVRGRFLENGSHKAALAEVSEPIGWTEEQLAAHRKRAVDQL